MACRPGYTAEESPRKGHGLFTAALLECIHEEWEFVHIHRYASARVHEESGSEQQPIYRDECVGIPGLHGPTRIILVE